MDLYKELSIDRNISLNNYIDKIKCHSEIVLYGAGLSGKVVSEWLKSNHIIPNGFIDSNPSKEGMFINNIKIYSKKKIAEKFINAFFIISCGDYALILNELENAGISKEKILYIDPKWIVQPSGIKKFIQCHISNLQEAYNILTDDLSKKVFLNMLKYKISYDTKYIKEIYSSWEERYFDSELISNKIIKNYVDAGGYDGDTVEMFVKKYGGYSNIYVFEPNKINAEQLETTIKKNGYHDVHIYREGLSDKKGEFFFDVSSGIATRMDKFGTEMISCDCLDNILYDKQIDMIKMDIEGSELSALIGGQHIIRCNKPILSICVYHKPEDYYEIPIYIKRLCPDYKIYFRQYELSDTETICYAIGEN